MVNIRKRDKVYQYQFEIVKVDEKRKYISKSGFKTKKEYFKINHKYSTAKDIKKHLKF